MRSRKLTSAELPMQMDIWHDGKVLNIEWDGAELIVVGDKPGVWEDVLKHCYLRRVGDSMTQ